jgi:hypothetical protein
MPTGFTDRAWFEHLTGVDQDVMRSLATAAGVDPVDLGDGSALTRMLSHPAAYEVAFGAGGNETELLAISPFLAFALIVHRGWYELRDVSHVDEWVGPRQRLPVLGGGDLRDFLGEADHRLFLTELLASYSRVASGVTWVHTRRGWRRRRFSELDPVRLASLLEVVPDAERPGVYRRFGDLALFLTGVFPDHVETRGLAPIAEARLTRLLGPASGQPPSPPTGGRNGTVALLEHLGQRCYRQAVRTAHPPTAALRLVADVGERFPLARRTLNYLADRHLFVFRDSWAPPGSA